MGTCITSASSSISKVLSNPTCTTCNTLNAEQWKNEIIKERQKQSNIVSEIIDRISDDYDLYVQYLSKPHTLSSSYSFISMIARITRQCSGCINVTILYDTSCSDTDLIGHKISVSIHPISGHIYIADDHSIYKLKQSKTNNNKLELIATIPEKYKKKQKFRITDITFNCNGNALLCIFYKQRDVLYFVDYNNAQKAMDERINLHQIYDRVNIAQYNVNNVSCLCSAVVLALCPALYIGNIFKSLYALDAYNKHLWFVRNTSVSIQLAMVPLDNYNEIDKLLTLKQQKNDRLQQKTNEFNSKDENKALSKEINEIEMQIKQFQVKLEVIDLWSLLELERSWKKRVSKKYGAMDANVNNQQYGGVKMEILAFDIDKYYGGIYMIVNDYMFYRIEPQEIQSNNEWRVTHKVSLRDVLSGGLPLGIYTVKYDSVTGRIIVADNYKIQALYI